MVILFKFKDSVLRSGRVSSQKSNTDFDVYGNREDLEHSKAENLEGRP